MASPRQLTILRDGIETWNRWRKSNLEAIPDLREAKLDRFDLRGGDLRVADLVLADLRNADLRRADLRSADLRDANLSGADLREADLTTADLRGANMSLANLSKVDLEDKNLKEVNFGGANLSEANLNRADLEKTILTGANLTKVHMKNVHLQGQNLTCVNFTEADLRGVDFRGANLRGANAFGANLGETDLRKADLREAILTGAKLLSARLQSANLDGADLTDACLWETQRALWSIKNVICKRAYWDREGREPVEYAPGEFEGLHSEQARIELFYKGGITTFELNTLPALLCRLANAHPDCEIRLKAIEETGGGAKVLIRLNESGAKTFAEIKAEAERLQLAQLALRDEVRRAERLEIEKRLLLHEVFPLVLAAAGPKFQIASVPQGMVIAGPNSSVHVEQVFNDVTDIRDLLQEVMNRQTELSLRPEQSEQFENMIRAVTSELQKNEPRRSVVAEGVKLVRDFVIGALGNAVGTAMAANAWGPLLDQLSRVASYLV